MHLENNNEHSSIWHSFTEILYCTLLYFWYNLFVIYSQNKKVCDSFSVTGMGHHDQWFQLHWYFFQFLNWSYEKLSACLSKFGVFIRNWPACFEKASFLYAGSYCTSKSQGLPFGSLNDFNPIAYGIFSFFQLPGGGGRFGPHPIKHN